MIEKQVREMDFLGEEMRGEIVSRYAGYMIAARYSLPRDQVMGAINALKAQRNAELAQVRDRVAKMLQSRIKSLLESRRALRGPKRPPEAKL